MNKENYEQPEMEIIGFTGEDIIVTSKCENETEDDVFA